MREQACKFDLLIEKLRNEFDPNNLKSSLFDVVTLFGQVPLDMALNAMDKLTHSFLNVIQLVEGYSVNCDTKNGYNLFLTNTGRLIIKDIKEGGINESIHLCKVSLKDFYVDMINEQYVEKMRKEKFYFQLVDKTICNMFDTGQWEDIINELEDSITRVETVFYYCGHNYYISALAQDTTLARWNNLVDNDTNKNSFFSQIKNKTYKELTEEEKVVVCTLACLNEIAGPQKYEELNGVCIGSAKLVEYLSNQYIMYDEKADYQLFKLLNEQNLMQFAIEIGRLYKSFSKKNVIRYRRINGFNFNKSMHCLPKYRLIEELTLLPKEIENYMIENSIILGADYKESIKNIMSDIFNSKYSQLRLKEFFELFVNSAKTVIGVDHVFTSGIDDISKLYAQSDPVNSFMSIEKEDMFCCFSGQTEFWHKYLLIGMQGNRWNYLAGNLREEDCEKHLRYYRVPLIYPDISYNNGYHHEGHAMLGVDSMFRVSGPMEDETELIVNNIPCIAFYDIRGFKSGSEGVTIDSLIKAIKFGKYLDIIWKEIKGNYENKNLVVPIVF